MATSDVTTADCPYCDAAVDHLRRGCDACGRRLDWSWTQPCRACGAAVDYAALGVSSSFRSGSARGSDHSTASCPECRAGLSPWDGVVARVRRERAHVDLRIARDAVPPPASAGFVLHAGDPRGQRADYRRPLPDGAGIHVKEFADRYEVHWDRVDPTRDFLGHVLADAPHWLLFGGFLGAKLARWPVGLTLGLASFIKR